MRKTRTNKVFELLASQMDTDFERSKQLRHELRKVTRESAVSNFLKDCLPKFLGVGSGQVISTEREVKGEVDIVIYDARNCPILPIAEGVQVFPIEGVYALVEVESYLNRKSLRKYIDKIELAKSLPKTAYYEQRGAVRKAVHLYGKELEYFPTFCIVFAFDSTDLRDLGRLLSEEYVGRGLSVEQQVDLICVLRKGLILHWDPKRKKIVFPAEPGSQVKNTKGTPGQNLLLFYILLTKVLTQAWTRPIRLQDYAEGAIYGHLE